MKEIKLPNNMVALVDDEDFKKINNYKWHVIKSYRSIYAQRHFKLNGKWQTMWMHRKVLNLDSGLTKDNEVDHINHNGLDNRKKNLRIGTHVQNMRNQVKRVGCSSYYKGVFWNKQCSKWRAYIFKEGIQYHLGYFNNENDAAIAYDKEAKKLFNDYKCLNFEER